jgi:hypothetical protein
VKHRACANGGKKLIFVVLSDCVRFTCSEEEVQSRLAAQLVPPLISTARFRGGALCLHGVFGRFGCDFDFIRSWRQTFISCLTRHGAGGAVVASAEDSRIDTLGLLTSPMCSDALYEPWCNGTLTIDPSWLVGGILHSKLN